MKIWLSAAIAAVIVSLCAIVGCGGGGSGEPPAQAIGTIHVVVTGQTGGFAKAVNPTFGFKAGMPLGKTYYSRLIHPDQPGGNVAQFDVVLYKPTKEEQNPTGGCTFYPMVFEDKNRNGICDASLAEQVNYWYENGYQSVIAYDTSKGNWRVLSTVLSGNIFVPADGHTMKITLFVPADGWPT